MPEVRCRGPVDLPTIGCPGRGWLHSRSPDRDGRRGSFEHPTGRIPVSGRWRTLGSAAGRAGQRWFWLARLTGLPRGHRCPRAIGGRRSERSSGTAGSPRQHRMAGPPAPDSRPPGTRPQPAVACASRTALRRPVHDPPGGAPLAEEPRQSRWQRRSTAPRTAASAAHWSAVLDTPGGRPPRAPNLAREGTQRGFRRAPDPGRIRDVNSEVPTRPSCPSRPTDSRMLDAGPTARDPRAPPAPANTPTPTEWNGRPQRPESVGGNGHKPRLRPHPQSNRHLRPRLDPPGGCGQPSEEPTDNPLETPAQRAERPWTTRRVVHSPPPTRLDDDDRP